MIKYTYAFGINPAEGNTQMYDLLGNKGANLAEMSNLGIDVPPGFTIPSTVCKLHYNELLNCEVFKKQILEGITFLEKNTGKKFGDSKNPLLLSVRSGASCSMPGMMDTILNLGLNLEIIEVWAQNNSWVAYDCYRRFIQMYGVVVLGIAEEQFEEILQKYRYFNTPSTEEDLPNTVLKDIINDFNQLIKNNNLTIPTKVEDQLYSAISAVIKSWQNERAIIYRQVNNIENKLGTAVNIQSMVFGNINNQSGSGVIFTRDPSTGSKKIFGEFLLNAQGEDIVAGTRTPHNIEKIKTLMPDIYNDLVKTGEILEKHYKDMQDIEFTIQDRKLWILQTRVGKRSVEASIKIAIDMVDEGLITKEEAIMRVEPKSLTNLLHATIDNTKQIKIIAQGLPASPGAATGIVVFSVEEALHKITDNKNLILVRSETSPEDIAGMNIAAGIVTARGGMTSHAAVIARGMGKPCVCGTSGLTINISEGYFITSSGIRINAGDTITIDGTNGKLMLGDVSTTLNELPEHFNIFMGWVDSINALKIRANADNFQDVKIAKKFGASGIGLCRTEHMFFSKERIELVRKLIITNSLQEKNFFLQALEHIQKSDFLEMFKESGYLPITIRLLDPPLHEFLPNNTTTITEFVNTSGFSSNFVQQRLSELKESNPMLGHRGCRLGISHPEIYDMQTRAIFIAATESKQLLKYSPNLEILIPFIINSAEMQYIKQRIENIAKNYNINYSIGSMIEIPSAALNAKSIAQVCDFFSFGTNDLTQTTLGLSRDDYNSFIHTYLAENIFINDPFLSIDRSVGELMQIAIERGRQGNPALKIGVCGEQGGHPQTIAFLSSLAVDYISCSPYRIPIAKLAAAQYGLNKLKNHLIN